MEKVLCTLECCEAKYGIEGATRRVRLKSLPDLTIHWSQIRVQPGSPHLQTTSHAESELKGFLDLEWQAHDTCSWYRDYLVKMLGVTDFSSGGIFQNQPDGLRHIITSQLKLAIIMVRSERTCGLGFCEQVQGNQRVKRGTGQQGTFSA